MNNYLKEAFSRLSLLEAEDFPVDDAEKIDELNSFVADDETNMKFDDEAKDIDVYDTEAGTVEELQDTYVGKVVIECRCCHNRFYKNEDEVYIDDEEDVANIDEECPVCNQLLGYNVIGKIEEFEPAEQEDGEDIEQEDGEPIPAAEDPELPPDDIEDEEEEVEESLASSQKACEDSKELDEAKGNNAYDKLMNYLGKKEVEEDLTPEDNGVIDQPLTSKEEWWGQTEEDPFEFAKEFNLKCKAVKRNGDETLYRFTGKQGDFDRAEDAGYFYSDAYESLTEGINDISIQSDNESISLNKDDTGRVSININPLDPIEENPGNNGEEIVPLEPEEVVDIENNVDPNADDEEKLEGPDFDEEPAEFEEEPTEDEEDEVDIDNFQEESFNYLGKTYLKKIYENVNDFETTNVKESDTGLIIEGLITFDSGSKRKTTFNFDNATFTKSGKVVMEGYNNTFSTNKKAFRIKGSLTKGNFITESLHYNYITKNLNESNNSTSYRIHGRVRVVK